MNNIKLLYIDLFCGAGGTSTGVEIARHNGLQCAKVVACVNHDANAIASHSANHPEALHFTEDIRTLELSPLLRHIKKFRLIYPKAFIVLWASLECTNFSKAKGGQPRDADSRTLAEHLYRYIKGINPDYIQIENVEEFMSWGDLDERGKPINKDAGRLYRQWLKNIQQYGYNFEHKILNSADFGAYTSRRRFFGIFARQRLPIVFPEPTHTKNKEASLFGDLQQWKPVKDVLDFNDEGESIFGRKKPLVEPTMERIYAGLIKFVAGGKGAFLSRYNTVKPKDTAKSIDEPCGVLTVHNRFAKVQCRFIQQRNSGDPRSKIISVDQPARTITATGGNQDVVSTHFLSKYYGGKPYSKNSPIDTPAGTITTRDHHSFISAYYGNGFSSPVNGPAPTITCKDRLSVINPRFLDMQYGNGTPTDVELPAATLTTNPKHQLVTVKPWIMNTNFGNVGSSIDSPSPVVTANRKWHYLMNPQFNSAGGSVDNPCFTLIARMDKMPPYLIATESGEIAIKIEETDSPVTVKIKEFMALYGIIDIKMRMLRIPELKQIMGFPKDYVLVGNQADQKKFIGNAVEVRTARKLCEALCIKIDQLQIYPQGIRAWIYRILHKINKCVKMGRIEIKRLGIGQIVMMDKGSDQATEMIVNFQSPDHRQTNVCPRSNLTTNYTVRTDRLTEVIA